MIQLMMHILKRMILLRNLYKNIAECYNYSWAATENFPRRGKKHARHMKQHLEFVTKFLKSNLLNQLLKAVLLHAWNLETSFQNRASIRQQVPDVNSYNLQNRKLLQKWITWKKWSNNIEILRKSKKYCSSICDMHGPKVTWCRTDVEEAIKNEFTWRWKLCHIT